MTSDRLFDGLSPSKGGVIRFSAQIIDNNGGGIDLKPDDSKVQAQRVPQIQPNTRKRTKKSMGIGVDI